MKAKKKYERVAEAVGDAYYEKANKIDVLSYGILAIAKGTRFYQDAIDIVKGCNPEYFKKD
ncbi:MAG TPA: hypothetical protein VEA37_12760 [Flavobacterium sp.]|nr:hypothetical protein [Flavobacterium sp.]